MKKFSDVVREYSQYKLKKTGDNKVTRAEISKLREAYKPVRPKQSSLKETVREYRQYKKAKTGSAEVTLKEYHKLKEGLMKLDGRKEQIKVGQFRTLVENYRQFKAAKNGTDARVSYKELKMLHEAFKKSGGRLREADQGFDPTGGMGGDPNAGMAPAAPGAVPGAPAVPPDPAIVAQIQDVKNSVDSLALAAGIQTADMGGDPNAGIPAATGEAIPPAGGAPAAPQPMLEALVKEYRNYKYKKTGNGNVTKGEVNRLSEALNSEYASKQPVKSKVEQIRERIAARQAALEGVRNDKLDENAAQDLGKKTLSKLGGPQARDSWLPDKSGGSSRKPDTAPSEELVTVPGAASIAKGVDGGKGASAGKTWPTKVTKESDTGGALQGASASQHGNKASPKVKESEDEEEIEGDKLEENVQNVTAQYVDRELTTPKLDFNRLKEAIATGLLG